MTGYLFDTHLLLWFGTESDRLPERAASLMADRSHRAVFSVVSTIEVAIKFSRNRSDFRIDPDRFRHQLLANGFEELPVTGEHACGLADLSSIHRDPWDRLLVAQATSEGLTLVTSDAVLGGYSGRVLVV